MSQKVRVDQLLVERGLADSRSQAQRFVMAGQVRAEGQLVHKASQRFDVNARLEIREGPRFVSRGGEKLDAALNRFPIPVRGSVCADVGASTGGFTDCLLQHGAARVYAIDVGYGLLHWKLRGNPAIVLLERTNARYLERLPESVSLVTVDASFISLGLLFPAIGRWTVEGGDVLALVKPQFEAGKDEVKRGGVVRDPQVHRRVVEQVMGYAREHTLTPAGVMRSPLEGPKGNIEFFLWCKKGGQASGSEDLLRKLFQQGSP